MDDPSVHPDSNFYFQNLSLTDQAEVLTIFKTQKTLSVLDFSGFQKKKNNKLNQTQKSFKEF